MGLLDPLFGYNFEKIGTYITYGSFDKLWCSFGWHRIGGKIVLYCMMPFVRWLAEFFETMAGQAVRKSALRGCGGGARPTWMYTTGLDWWQPIWMHSWLNWCMHDWRKICDQCVQKMKSKYRSKSICVIKVGNQSPDGSESIWLMYTIEVRTIDIRDWTTQFDENINHLISHHQVDKGHTW